MLCRPHDLASIKCCSTAIYVDFSLGCCDPICLVLLLPVLLSQAYVPVHLMGQPQCSHNCVGLSRQLTWLKINYAFLLGHFETSSLNYTSSIATTESPKAVTAQVYIKLSYPRIAQSPSMDSRSL